MLLLLLLAEHVLQRIKARRTGRAVKQAVTSAPEKRREASKTGLREALAVAKRMSEETD